ncbi:MAG: hypothetical protein B7X58_02850 [Marinobacter sp. 34-60-7]|nr:MAG: hypothetical protein B7X58_02850 [Marinobacter sp. 34-60-7]
MPIRTGVGLAMLLWAVGPTATAGEDGQSWWVEVLSEQNTLLAQARLPESNEWCLLWNHSVQGFPVADCFRVTEGQLFLDSSHTPDFAAGLGYIEGRGRLESDQNHGYRIEDMNVPIAGNVLPLRVGSNAVRHRVQLGDDTLELSDIAAHRRVDLRITQKRSEGTQHP